MHKLVIVDKIGDDKIGLIKYLREMADLSLKEAKELMDYLSENKSTVLIAGIDEEKAKKVADSLTKLKCSVQVKDTDISNSMLAFPKAKYNYEMNFFSGVKRV